jgi:hypothetical protein
MLSIAEEAATILIRVSMSRALAASSCPVVATTQMLRQPR